MTGSSFDGSRSASDRDPLPLDHAIRDYLDLHDLAAAGVLSRILAVWDDAVGPEMAAHARPVGLHGEELVITVDHATWATELSFLQESLLTGLTERLGTAPARRVNVRIQP